MGRDSGTVAAPVAAAVTLGLFLGIYCFAFWMGWRLA